MSRYSGSYGYSTRLPLLYQSRTKGASDGRATPAPKRLSQQLSSEFRYLRASAPASLVELSSPAHGKKLWIGLDGFVSNWSAILDQTAISQLKDDKSRIAQLYHLTGPDGLSQLEGSFVMVIVDLAKEQVVAFRDRLGGQRLCWRGNGHDLILATRAADLLAAQGTSGNENQAFISRLMGLNSISDPGNTPFQGIQELKAGEILIQAQGRIALERAPFQFSDVAKRHSTDEWVERFSNCLETAVLACIGQTGPVASMLSGGLDSGPATILAHDQLSRSGRELIPVSWLLPSNRRGDETRSIRQLSDYLNCRLTSFPGDEMLPFRHLHTGLVSPELPMLNGFRELKLNCYRLAAEAGCEIILNGHVGDRIYWPRDYLLIDPWKRREYREVLRTFIRIFRQIGLVGLWTDRSFRAPIGRLISPLRGKPQKAPWLTDFARRHFLDDLENDWPPEASQHHLPERARELIGTRMAFGLAYENDFANRYGIQRRDPFKNEALVRLMLQMPASLSHREGKSKWIMRETMKGRMPERLRLKPRTGNLNSFFYAGFNKHRKGIHDLLFKRQRDWQHYVKSEYIEQALKETNPAKQAKLAINECVGYALWREYWEKR